VRIALVYAHFNETGSLPRQQVQLARYLVGAGHEVHAYSYAPVRRPDLAPGVRFHDVPATRASGSRLGQPLHVATFARNATALIRRDRARYDLVHGRGTSTWEQDIVHVTGVVSGELRRDRIARDRPAGSRGLENALLPLTAPIVLVRRAIERRVFGKALPFEIHVSSRLIRDDLLAAYDVDPARVRVVVPAVDLAEFRPAADRLGARRALGLSPTDTIVLFCGHSFERKGLDRAVGALARMERAARLVVVGAGDTGRYLALARRLGVGDRVELVGPRTDTWRFFQAADVFVLPTRVDMWGMTVAEAMAAAVPPVTTDAAGAADVIAEG
jgi:glycosyltransferase involved in cell wall biosynthesis